jgi:RNA polymerase sigma factor (sigma-70 family)
VCEVALAPDRPRLVAWGSEEATVVVRSLEDARDRELVRRVVEGDEMAFRDLFNRYGPPAKSLAVRVVRQPFLAEEIVQEAFLVLWRDPGAYREERGTFRAWLMSTVHHRAVDVVRREETQRKRAREELPDVEREADVGDVVAEQTDLAGSRIKVRRALEEIPPAQRQVLELMYFEGKTQTTIADELELPLGTVKSRTLLGMRRLRAMLLEAAE